MEALPPKGSPSLVQERAQAQLVGVSGDLF